MTINKQNGSESKMEPEEAYQTLKNCIELDSEELEEAYQVTIDNPNEYEEIVRHQCDITKSSVEIGQSMVALGELVRQFYNGTHRQIDDEIIDLPGANLCKELGKIVNESIQQVVNINICTEEWAATQISCNETVDISYM